MYLKSLKLVGFKSFADRTRLELRPGVTVIVGPNGSGKSNVVDAISWVMGTQSTKALRTGKMEDVVFAGTATRPALGRAEATVIIDNTERRIDLDLDEVSITRRLYRDGSSDYELNGVGCRLLDIQELLSDSGVGRHQHVIIGQGQVDEVLNASPEDHRAVIEEAAGILKHRRRKEKAERRLERTDEDLLRLTDLLGEIARQMRPLRRQAGAAERYQGVKDQVMSLTLYISGQTLAAINDDLAASQLEKAGLDDLIIEETARINSGSAQLTRLTAEARSLGADLERDSAAAAVLETTTERLRRMASVAHERRRALTGRRQAAEDRRGDLESERQALLDELDVIVGDEPDAIAMAEAREERFRHLEAEQRAVTTQNALSPEGALAAVRGELSVLEAASVRDGRETTAIEKRLDVVVSQIDSEEAEVARINDEIKEIDSTARESQRSYEVAKTQRVSDQESWTVAEGRFSEARMRVAAAQARVDAIRSATSGRFDEEARRQVEMTAGAIGSLISQLDVPEGLEAAVEAGLGTWADAIAFDGVASMQHVVETVKAGGMGGVPVVAAITPGSAAAKELVSDLGIDALIDLLGPATHTALATRLLGDVVLVEGWTAAWRLIARHPALRAVTPEGDLISVSGIRVAHADGAEVAMLEAAEVSLEKALTDLARADSQHTAAKRGFELSREAERSGLEALETLEARLAGGTEAMARLQKSVDVLTSERKRLEARLALIGEAATERDRHSKELRARLSSLEGEEAEQMQVWEDLESRRVQLAAECEVARSAWQESAERLRAIGERRSLHEERIARIELEMGHLDQGTLDPISSAALETVESSARAAVELLEVRLAELRERQNTLRSANAQTVAALEAARASHESSRTAVEAARERTSKLDVRLTELRLQKESIADRLRRDADADFDAALNARRPDLPEDVDLEELLDSKLAELARLGPVNPLAAAEFADLEERHNFLSEQMADVESSRKELRKVITALDEEIDARFRSAFEEVAAAYQKYFALLFPGGKGRIRLVDPDDAQSGLEIQAQPLGKKVSQLTLLSGGERSLAALAFLFAVFEARPSPFYILDEVEAALDDANLRRFLKIVDEFRQRAQLVIVTHQQQTMEAADVLYGVTMEPGGSSQVVRKAMTDVDSVQVA